MPSRSFPALAFSVLILGPVLGLILGLGAAGCSSSFCGAPCEAAAAKADAAQAAKAAKAARAQAAKDAKSAKAAQMEKDKATRAAARKDTLPVLVNQYGSFFGHVEVDSLTATQLRVEKTSLEVMLAGDPKDKEILKVLKEGKLDTTTFDYNDYSTGGARYSASGKLRRDVAAQDDQRRLPRMISESQNRELIERYRQVRRRISRMPVPPSPAPADSVAGTVAGTAGDSSAARPTASPAAPAAPVSAPPDSVWTGRCRANGDSLAVPEAFTLLEACEAWGREQSGGFRAKAYSFECECRKDGERVKRKFW